MVDKIPIHMTTGMHFEYNGEMVCMVRGSLVMDEHTATCSVANDDVIFENVDATTMVEPRPGTLYG
ncbi:hypothetical protein [Escherichia phage EP_H11]|nr:hypothetical protein [Escherichia phage EP_H11]